MASITFTIPDALVPRLAAAASATYPQYSALANGALAKAVTVQFWKDLLSQYEGNAAANGVSSSITAAMATAYSAAASKANTDAAGIS